MIIFRLQEQALIAAVGSRPTSIAYDAVTPTGSTFLIGRVLAKTSPDGTGKIAIVWDLSEEDQRQFPPGVVPLRTRVGTAYGADEACEHNCFHLIHVWLHSGFPIDLPCMD